MEKKGKMKVVEMRCDCGEYFEERVVTEGFSFPITVCRGCGHRVFTVEQAKQYVRLERLHKSFRRKRKLIRIGNGLGFTLPKTLQEWGFKEGMSVSIERLGKNALKIELG